MMTKTPGRWSVPNSRMAVKIVTLFGEKKIGPTKREKTLKIKIEF